jgi:hypothetical protein
MPHHISDNQENLQLRTFGFKDAGNAAAVRPSMTDHKPWKIDGRTKSCQFFPTRLAAFGGSALPSLAASFGEP